MRYKILFPTVYLFAFFFCGVAVAQKKFTATIQFPSQLNSKNISLSYDNGIEIINVKPDFKEGKITISDTFYSQYATLEIVYPSGNPMLPHYKAFFVTDKPATIAFTASNSLEEPLEHYELKNAHDINGMGADKMKTFVSTEEKDFFDFMAANQAKLGASDSLVAILFEKSTRLANKKAAFVKQNGELYYSFWLFRRELTPNTLLSADSLLSIFNTAFPADFKQSREGVEVEKVLRGRNIKKGQEVSNFSVTDVNGEATKTSDYRGKYLLINFWASWCKPCLEEMPVITEIRKRYSADKLEVLFITLDQDSTVSAKTVEKYKMKGVHIMGNADLITIFGAQAIPVVYLVDPEGIVIYSRDEEKDVQLQLLPEILEKRLWK